MWNLMPISEKLKALIRSAWDDGAPCLLATQGPNGPNISPKGSMVVFDATTISPIGERSKKQALENLGHDERTGHAQHFTCDGQRASSAQLWR
jgi:hypothetical protein